MAFAASGCMRADWGSAREEVMGELRTASRTGSKAGMACQRDWRVYLRCMDNSGITGLTVAVYWPYALGLESVNGQMDDL